MIFVYDLVYDQGVCLLYRSVESQRYSPCGKGAVTIVYASYQRPALTGLNRIREDVFPHREKLLADAVKQFLKPEIGNGMSLIGTSVDYVVGNFNRCIHFYQVNQRTVFFETGRGYLSGSDTVAL